MNEVLERIIELLTERNIKVSEMCDELKIPRSTCSTWKLKDKIPDSKYLEAIAKYFGISIDYLLTGKKYYTDPEAARIAEELRTNEGLKMMFHAWRDVNPEILRLNAEMLIDMAKTEKE